MRARHLLPALLALLVPLSANAARQWTSSDGQHRIEADLVGFDAQQVRLKKIPGGDVVAVPLNRLSEADRNWLADVVKRQEAARKVLEKKGLRITSDGLQLPQELELKAGLRDLPKSKKKVLDSERQLEIAQKQVDENEANINKLVEANRQLNTRLVLINPIQVTVNNKLVGAIRANEAQITLIAKQGEKLDAQLKKARAEANQDRESYLESLLTLRKLADQIAASYKQLAESPEIVAAVTGLNETTPGTYALGQSRSLIASIRQLEKLEEGVFSESIPLRSEGGTLYASVVINGKYSQEMVVDSGASVLMLPPTLASQFGIQPKPTDPTVGLELADGSRISGKLVKLESVRVGQFIVENVDCAVLDIQAIRAEPLLGMSFLENFQFKIDASKETMTLVEVKSGDKPGKSSR